MPQFCAVVGCGSRGGRDNVSFFSFPTGRKRGGHEDPIAELRREKWIAALQRKGLTDALLKNQQVCSKHFISGKPSSVTDIDNPDWIPSLNMGYEKNLPSSTSHINRNESIPGPSSNEMEVPSVEPSEPSVPMELIDTPPNNLLKTLDTFGKMQDEDLNFSMLLYHEIKQLSSREIKKNLYRYFQRGLLIALEQDELFKTYKKFTSNFS